MFVVRSVVVVVAPSREARCKSRISRLSVSRAAKIFRGEYMSAVSLHRTKISFIARGEPSPSIPADALWGPSPSSRANGGEAIAATLVG